LISRNKNEKKNGKGRYTNTRETGVALIRQLYGRCIAALHLATSKSRRDRQTACLCIASPPYYGPIVCSRFPRFDFR